MAEPNCQGTYRQLVAEPNRLAIPLSDRQLVAEPNQLAQTAWQWLSLTARKPIASWWLSLTNWPSPKCPGWYSNLTDAISWAKLQILPYVVCLHLPLIANPSKPPFLPLPYRAAQNVQFGKGIDTQKPISEI